MRIGISRFSSPFLSILSHGSAPDPYKQKTQPLTSTNKNNVTPTSPSKKRHSCESPTPFS